ncbi:MAG: tetratricopeptide repeat protein [Fibrobacterota bacterium]
MNLRKTVSLCTVATAAFWAFSCTSPVEVDTEDLETYDHGVTLQMDSVDLHGAASIFTDVIADYPWSIKYDNALYRRGKCYYDIAGGATAADTAVIYARKAQQDWAAIPEKSNLLVDGLFMTASAERRVYTNDAAAEADAVRDAFLHVITHYPAHEKAGESCLELGDFYYTMENLDSARIYYELFPAEHQWPNANSSAEAILRLGHIDRETGHTTAALERYEEILNTYGSSWYYDNALYWAGSTALDLGEREKAETWLTQYVDDYPEETYIDSAKEKLAELQGN